VKLLATPRFLRSVPPARREEVMMAMKAAGSAYGYPHLHAGLGIRRIKPYIECRCGRDLRLIFRRENNDLVFHICGNHDEVQAFLKNQS
jgi:hypothetical protein